MLCETCELFVMCTWLQTSTGLPKVGSVGQSWPTHYVQFSPPDVSREENIFKKKVQCVVILYLNIQKLTKIINRCEVLH